MIASLALAIGALQACAPAPALRLDHVPVAVRDLDAAATMWQSLGFTLKPGRAHANGIRNLHAKFADGTEIELITAAEARDELSAHYVDFLRDGDGGAFLALHAGAGFRTPPSLPLDHPLGWIFFGQLNRSPTDRPEHFVHANGAQTLQAVWLAAPDHGELLELLERYDARPCDGGTRVPLAASDELRLLPPDTSLPPGRRILGVSVTVADLDRAVEVLAAAGVPAQARGESVLVAPLHASRVWLELREPPS